MASNLLYFALLIAFLIQLGTSIDTYDETDEETDNEATYDPKKVEKTLLRAIELNRLSSTPELRHSKRVRTSPQDTAATLLLNTLRPSTSRAQAPDWDLEQIDNEGADPSWCPENFFIGGRNITLQTMKKIINLHDAGRSEAKIRKQYGWYHRQYLTRFKECIARGYKRSDVYRLIKEGVHRKFLDYREKGLPIRGYNIRLWALREARGRNLTNFVASHTFLEKFKKDYRIRSRKVTKTVSSSHLANRLEDMEKIREFREGYESVSPFFRKQLIFNVDQTGFNPEPSTDRTLSIQGERDTILYADSVNKQTHSYTAQPVISRQGRLVGKLALILQEDKGRFGPIIMRKVQKMENDFKNIKLYPSKSGKMNSSLTANWTLEVLIPAVNDFVNSTLGEDEEQPLSYDEESLRANDAHSLISADAECSNEARRAMNCERLTWPKTVHCENVLRHRATERCSNKPIALVLMDAWSGNKNISKIGRPNHIQSLIIPERTTAELQPLDVGMMRQYKSFVNRISQQALFEDKIRIVTSREGVVNMHSLIWNQFNSPAYDPMLRWCWHKTDPSYNETERGELPLMVRAIQFAFAEPTCSQDRCQNEAFVRCSHCGRVLCLHHFLERNCFHDREENINAIDRIEAIRLLGGVGDDEDEELFDDDAREEQEIEEFERFFMEN